jgi:glycosyltransferase involved in cell wall biosynthesis
MDVVVVPSYDESFGNTVVEAVSMGTPVVISEHVGVRDWVKENDVGEVLPLDVDSWARVIENLEREKIKERWNPATLRAAAISSFSLEPVAKQMLAEYEKILAAQNFINVGKVR